MNPNSNKEIVAVDISKQTLEVKTQALSRTYANDQKGIAKLVETLNILEHPFVVYEATGGYERQLRESLCKNGIPQQMVPPSRVRAFAQSEGVKAKTDPIDVAMIFRFIQEKGLQPLNARSDANEELIALMDRRIQLTGLMSQEKIRLQNTSRSIIPLIREMIFSIEAQIQKTEIAMSVATNRRRCANVTSERFTPGIKLLELSPAQ